MDAPDPTGGRALRVAPEALRRALERREALAEELAREGTDCLRLFHGVAEGASGLTIDRYGPLVLVQTFREPLAEGELERIEGLLRARSGPAGEPLEIVWNHRGERRGEAFERWHRPPERALAPVACRELGVRHEVRARHRGQDPWLFLDLRAGRRLLRELAPGKSVVNFFAYTGGAGLAAAVFGAREVLDVDFSASALEVARRGARENGVEQRVSFLREDFFPVARQLAGLPVKGRAGGRPYARVEPRRFDVAFLDPPAWSRGPFGAVDVARDYASLFKPVVLALEDGGAVVATNHVAEVALEPWLEGLRRTAAKAGRPLRSLEAFGPDADFPSFDARPPLKIALARV